MNLNELQGRFADFDDFAMELSDPGFAPKFVFIEPKYSADKFDVEGPGHFQCGNSMHPVDDVTHGEQLIKTVYESIRNSPHWDKSLLVITFDEHGGFYDHVKPPSAIPPGDVVTESYVQYGFTYDVLGVRVPALAISPLIGRGVIDHTQYDHTSILATVERLFGTRNLTNRDNAANDVLHLLSLTEPRSDTPTSLPPPAINPHPMNCGQDDLESLLEQRSALRTARDEAIYGGERVPPSPMTPTQVGFTQVALLRVLNDVQEPERSRWIERYKAVDSSIDAALFMVDAKIEVRHHVNPPDATNDLGGSVP